MIQTFLKVFYSRINLVAKIRAKYVYVSQVECSLRAKNKQKLRSLTKIDNLYIPEIERKLEERFE